MPDKTIAKIAVSGVPYRLDRPYDYTIPEELSQAVVPGVRVSVPFTRANRRTEGIVLALAGGSSFEKLKPISAVLDSEPLLTEEQLKLAIWMRERFFCTVSEAVRAMLPAGLWFRDDGRRRVADRRVEVARLAVPSEEAMDAAEQRRRRAPQQSELLRTLCAVGQASVHELRDFTGASAQSLKALIKAGFVETESVQVFRRRRCRSSRRASSGRLRAYLSAQTAGRGPRCCSVSRAAARRRCTSA